MLTHIFDTCNVILKQERQGKSKQDKVSAYSIDSSSPPPSSPKTSCIYNSSINLFNMQYHSYFLSDSTSTPSPLFTLRLKCLLMTQGKFEILFNLVITEQHLQVDMISRCRKQVETRREGEEEGKRYAWIHSTHNRH